MPYTINRTDGTTLATIADGVVDTTTDLQLVGRNVAGYGEIQNENFLSLLENFAKADNPPPRPQVGQVWFDKNTDKMRPAVFDGVQWRQIGVVQIAPETQEPNNRKEGDLWWDSTNNKLYSWTADGDKHILVGPEDLKGYEFTKWVSMILTDDQGTDHPVVAGHINNVVYAILADDEFTIDQAVTPMPNFTKCYRGTTLKGTNANGISTDTKHHGTATDSDRLGGRLASTWANRNDNEEITGVYSFKNNDGINIGANSELKINVDSGNQNARIVNEVDDVLIFGANYSGSGPDKTVFAISGKDILPFGDNQVNMGSPSLKFRNIYSDAIYANIIGDIVGQSQGTHTGNVIGSVIGNMTGDSIGIHTGSLKNNVGNVLVDADNNRFEGTAAFVDDGVYLSTAQTITGNKTLSGTTTATGAVNVNNTLTAWMTNLSKGTIGAGAVPSLDSGRAITDLTIDGVTVQNSEIHATELNNVVIQSGSRIENSSLGTQGTLTNVKSALFTDPTGSSFKYISKDGTFNTADNDTVVTALAIKQYVDSKVDGITKDIAFHLDTKDMGIDDVKNQLQRLAPANEYPLGTVARILGSYYYANHPSGQFFRRYGTVTYRRYGIGYIGGRTYTSTGVKANVTNLINAKSSTTGYKFIKRGVGAPTTTTRNVGSNIGSSVDFTTRVKAGTIDGWIRFIDRGIDQSIADYFGIPFAKDARVLVFEDGVVVGYSFGLNDLQVISSVGEKVIGRDNFASGSHTINWSNFFTIPSMPANSSIDTYSYDVTTKNYAGTWEYVGSI